jgi:hypothetical protein
MINKILESKSSAMFIAMHMLTFKKEMKGLLPEMMYVFDNENMLNFFKIFGGKDIKVPEYEDLRIALLASAYFYYSKIEKYSDSHINTVLKLKASERNKIKILVFDWFESLPEEDKKLFLSSTGIKDIL